jgi:outer membrane protein OmpA-like peptidoglycan-associated protein
MLHRFRHFLLVVLLAASTPALAQEKDVEGSRDHPLVGRYEGAAIAYYQKFDFDKTRLISAPLHSHPVDDQYRDAANTIALEGRVTRIRYSGPEGRSALEILANFEQSLTQKGFRTVFRCEKEACMDSGDAFYVFGSEADDVAKNYLYADSVYYLLTKLTRDTGDVYAMILVGEGLNAVTTKVEVVEAKPLETNKIIFLDAPAINKSIIASGHATLYGVPFDFDKAEIKPEARPQVAEIAKLMKSAPDLSVLIVGHTDGEGGFDYNLDLSRRRAAAIVASLVKDFGIDAKRLKAVGDGMSAPIDTNATEEGRTRNRRVELVKAMGL